jgi:hypothetical protein
LWETLPEEVAVFVTGDAVFDSDAVAEAKGAFLDLHDISTEETRITRENIFLIKKV